MSPEREIVARYSRVRRRTEDFRVEVDPLSLTEGCGLLRWRVGLFAWSSVKCQGMTTVTSIDALVSTMRDLDVFTRRMSDRRYL